MLKRIILSAAMLILIPSLSLSEVAAQEASGTIEGRLVNGTAGGSSVADVEVQLKTFVDYQETGTPLTTKSRNDGWFTFSNLSTDPKNIYLVTLIYQDVEYFSDDIILGQGKTSESVNITVYDVTKSAEIIRVSTAHTIINPGLNNLEIMVIYNFANDTDRAYVGNLTFSLPQGATGIQFGGGLMEHSILPSHEGFIDTMPVLPGGREIVYTYNVTYSGGKYNFRQKLHYPVTGFNLFVQGEDIKIVSDRLANMGPMDMGTGTYYIYLRGQDLESGETVSATLSGLPGSFNQKLMIILVAAALTVMAVGAGVFYRRTRGKTRAQPVRVEGKPALSAAEGSDRRERKLLIELARLDDDFDAGRIQEEAYRAQRAAKKAQLVKLISSSREASGRR